MSRLSRMEAAGREAARAAVRRVIREWQSGAFHQPTRWWAEQNIVMPADARGRVSPAGRAAALAELPIAWAEIAESIIARHRAGLREVAR